MIPAVAISAVALQMSCVAGWLGLAVVAIVLSRSNRCTVVIYGATLAVCAVALFGSIRWLTGDTTNATVRLPAEPVSMELNPLESVLAEVNTEDWHQ